MSRREYQIEVAKCGHLNVPEPNPIGTRPYETPTFCCCRCAPNIVHTWPCISCRDRKEAVYEKVERVRP